MKLIHNNIHVHEIFAIKKGNTENYDAFELILVKTFYLNIEATKFIIQKKLTPAALLRIHDLQTKKKATRK